MLKGTAAASSDHKCSGVCAKGTGGTGLPIGNQPSATPPGIGTGEAVGGKLPPGNELVFIRKFSKLGGVMGELSCRQTPG